MTGVQTCALPISLRVYRLARFASKFPCFEMGKACFKMVVKVKDELIRLDSERVSREMFKALESKKPSRFFDSLSDFGVLGIHFPELQALKVPDKHDGTAYRHVMNLLDRCAKAGRLFDTRILFGLLCHDFGKGVTPKENHPSHYDHDRLGMPIVKSFCSRMRISNKMRDFAIKCCESHLMMRNLPIMKPSKAINFCHKLGNDWRDLGLVSFLDAVYRDGANSMVESKLYMDIKSIHKKVSEVSKRFTGRNLLERGVKPGPNFGKRLLEERVALFKSL